jgi:DNA ligase-1
MNFNLPILSGIDTKGKTKTWEVSVLNCGSYSEIKLRYGYDKKIETVTRVSEGKNLGKKNETTHFQQAVSEAQSKWNKKRDHEGYVSSNDIQTSSETKTSEATIFPMLAHDYFKHQSKVKFPAFVQSKLDGYRMIYHNGTCTSRQGTSFDILKETKLYKELQKIKNVILDGELYLHNGTFEHLGILRKKKLSGDDFEKLNQIEYHVYDIIMEGVPFKERLEELKKIKFGPKIKLVETFKVASETELKEYHQKFLLDNYEGTMIRNPDGLYKCKARSTDLLKYKDFQDTEYDIIDYTFEKDTSGEDDNLIVWVCQNENGDHFNVRPQGTREERKMIYQQCENDFSQFRSKKLWTKFFELTDRGVPRFPTTKTNTYVSYIRNVIY